MPILRSLYYLCILLALKVHTAASLLCWEKKHSELPFLKITESRALKDFERSSVPLL